jgi:serine/threonine-protein kinase
VTLASLQPGSLFGSRWIVGRLLGKNELAVVYEAEEARKARFAALKLLDSAFGRDGAAWTRFETLTRAIAQIPGDGIARSYDIGSSEGRPFVITERCVFPTLSRYLAERGPLKPRALRETLATLAGALDAVHGAGITHGNLKPQNVFVSADNTAWARLTDFGFAELREASGINQPRTLGWSAPEVSPAPATPSSDLFVLGLLCFFALSGSPWYSAQRTKTSGGGELPRSASERARVLGAEIPQALDAWFERALARDPADRFGNAIDMAHAFSRALEGRTESVPSTVAAPESAAGPLSATIPVPERSPFANPAISLHRPPESKALDPNGPTAPQFQVAATVPVPARPDPAFTSTPAPTPSNPPQHFSTNPTAPPRSSIVLPPPSVIMIVAGALLFGAIAIAGLVWLFAR